jgi:hypothetical protein
MDSKKFSFAVRLGRVRNIPILGLSSDPFLIGSASQSLINRSVPPLNRFDLPAIALGNEIRMHRHVPRPAL